MPSNEAKTTVKVKLFPLYVICNFVLYKLNAIPLCCIWSNVLCSWFFTFYIRRLQSNCFTEYFQLCLHKICLSIGIKLCYHNIFGFYKFTSFSLRFVSDWWFWLANTSNYKCQNTYQSTTMNCNDIYFSNTTAPIVKFRDSKIFWVSMEGFGHGVAAKQQWSHFSRVWHNHPI